MKRSALTPKHQLLVCVNQRAEGDPLGAGCGARGESVYHALKTEVARRGVHTQVWVTRTYCLGHCPRRGATVGCHPGAHFFIEVEPDDVQALWQHAQLP